MFSKELGQACIHNYDSITHDIILCSSVAPQASVQLDNIIPCDSGAD